MTFEEFTAQIRKVWPKGGRLIDDHHGGDWVCPDYTFIAPVTGVIVQWFKPRYENHYHTDAWQVCRGDDIYRGDSFALAIALAHSEIFTLPLPNI